ncbi:MAG TPA: glycosyltransferase family 39 protein [Chthoniobacterales bacterium]
MPGTLNTDGRHRPSYRRLAAILVVALILRLIYLAWAQAHAFGYQTDSIEAYEVAVQFDAGDERARYLGQPNCNSHAKLPGPLWTMFCLAGMKLTGGSISGIVFLIILANIAAIALTWRLTHDLCGDSAADAAALFMAVSPMAVHYSSIVWNPSLLPLFGAVIFFCLFRCLRKTRSRAIFVVAFLLFIGPQFHLSTLALVVPLAAFAWLARLKPNWRWLVVGIIAAALCYVPYIFGEISHDWENTRAIFLGDRHGFTSGALKVFSSPFGFLVNYWDPGWTYAPGDYQTLARRTFGGIIGMAAVNLVSAVFAALVVLGVIRSAAAQMKESRGGLREIMAHPTGVVPAAFLLLSYLAFNLVAGISFHGRYCLLVLPLIFALAGVGAIKCLETPRLRHVGSAPSTPAAPLRRRGFELNVFFRPALLLTIAANLWFTPAMCRFERDRISFGPVFVPGYAKLESVYQQLKPRAPDRLVEIRDDAYMASFPLLDSNKIYLHSGLVRRYVRAREAYLTAAGKKFSQVNVFELRTANLVEATDPAVAFYGNGIALVAVP